MPDYEATLKQHFQAVVDGSRAAQNAIEQAARYWREVYSVQVPNAEHQLVPGTLMEALDDTANRLEGLAKAISAKL